MQQTDKQQFVHVGGPGRGQGRNSELDDQLGEGACLARIYGFSYEGTYYELPTPALFLVHGEGTNAAEFGGEENQPDDLAARAPNNPSLSGVAAADFQFANDIRVWAYDKGDYSIRMDVMSGQLEEILLNIFFEVDLPAIRGAMVGGAGGPKGAMVSGAKVRGAMVRGAMVRGAMVGGNRNRD